MRKVRSYSFSQIWKAGHYGPTRTLSYRIGREKFSVEINAGSSDSVYPYRDGDTLLLVTINRRYGYAGLEAFLGGVKVGDTFLQNDWEIREILGKKGVDLEPCTIIRRLIPYTLQ